MKIKKVVQLLTAFVLSLYSLLAFSIPLAHAATSTCTWTDGSGSDDNFSTASNWSCTGTTPGNGDTYNLIFPDTAAGFEPIDDLSGMTAGSITFQGNFGNSGYMISPSNSNNVITVTGDINDNSTSTTGNQIDGNINLSGLVSITHEFSSDSSSRLLISSAGYTLGIGGNTLTMANVTVGSPITGGGSLVVNDSVYPSDTDGVDLVQPSPGFTGSLAVDQGALFVDNAGALTAATSVTVASGGLLKGNGGVSSLAVQSGGTVAPGHSPGCIAATSLMLSGTYLAQVGGVNACTDYDQLQISNSIDLTNGILQLNLLSGFTPTIGQSFTIINNSGNNAIIGTFNGLPEGATFTSGNSTFKITYTGGNGNDVVVTAVVPVVSAVTPGSPNTGLTAVRAHPLITLLVSGGATLGLVIIARRLKPLKD